jgi:hypothetical protein
MTFTRNLAAATLIAVGLASFGASAQPPADPAPLTPAQVKTVIEGRLAMKRSDLKVGKVVEKDAQTYDVELLKTDGTVQEHALVDKQFARPAGALSHGHGQGFGRHGMRGPGGGMGCDRGA